MLEQGTDTTSGMQTCSQQWTAVDWEQVRTGSHRYVAARHVFRLATTREPGGRWRTLRTNVTEIVVTGDHSIAMIIAF